MITYIFIEILYYIMDTIVLIKLRNIRIRSISTEAYIIIYNLAVSN